MTDKSESRLHGTYAEFDSVDKLLAACRRVRDAGYTKTDAYTPFPVHGIDKALGIKPTVLPWIALAMGLTGTTIAISMQIWMNAIDYPYIISGKPFISMPAFIPVSFELTVLLASFGAFFGMLALNKLPCYSNPVFTDPRFDRATDDRFFLYIESKDPKYDKNAVAKLFGDFGGGHVDHIYEDTSSNAIPKWIFVAVGLLMLGSTIPALAVARMRVTNSDSPRYHVFYDMDFSPAKDAQTVTTLFADGRSMRPDVPGTIAIGQYDEAMDFYTGIDMEKLSQSDAPRAERLVRALLEPVPQEGDEPATEPETTPPAEEPKTEEPAVEEPKTEEPKTEEPKTEEPKTDEPKTDEPKTEEPKTEEPKSEEPVAEEPMVEEPKTEEPAPSEEPASEEAPAAEEPKTEEPKSEEPMKEEAPVAEAVPAATPAPATTPTPAPGAVPPPAVVDNTPWLTENPLKPSTAVLAKGREKFEIYCAVCHGNDGKGNGLVNRRAQRILATAWVQPSSMHQDTLYSDQYADGKLFNTITNGIRKMPGYASQISSKDRWAIVHYVRALQASQNASLEDLPTDKRNELKKQQADVEKRLAEQAEQERKKAEEAAKKS